jgi:catecholate siderophore receptor
MRRRLPIVVVLFLLILSSAAAHGEDLIVRGTVLDSTRAPIAGARITAAADRGGAGPSTVTDARGGFSLALHSSAAIVTIAADGFVEVSRPASAWRSANDTPEFVLQVAGFHESVAVSAPSGYRIPLTTSATRTPTPLLDVPQSIAIVTRELIDDQQLTSVGDVVRYTPGISAHQGENNRDQVIIRGNNSSADFFLDGVRDDVQYFRDLYNLDRVEALKGPNAMIFGRGGGGGVINRVTKQAGFRPLREITVRGGAFDHHRVAIDVGQPLGTTVALRVNGMYENSQSFRRAVGLERYGISPTVTFAPGSRTKITLGFEHLDDTRVADRGIPSFQGKPIDVDPSTFYGNPDDSHVRARVNLWSSLVERRAGDMTIRSRTLVGAYARRYQNFVPGAVSADRQVALSTYNNATARTNVFNQTDLTYNRTIGRLRHTMLAGAELGRQQTANFRSTGYFNDVAASLLVPFDNPTIQVPVVYRQNATDADNHLRTIVAAGYLQDQVDVSRHFQLVGGLRFDRFDLKYHNNRSGATLTRPDNLVSPRVGLVFKPSHATALYSSYSVSFLPSSGDQFSSLTTITQQVKPERFRNYEIGAKWDAKAELSMTAAVYRLDRDNTRSTDPNDSTRIVQTGSQRTNGFELGINGRVVPAWMVAGGYAYQDALVTHATLAAAAGATMAQVPHHSFSLWNRYQFHPRLGAGLGVSRRSDMYAAIDDTVTLPGYTRADAALFFTLSKSVRVQANVENLFDKRYFVNADNNTNISPGFPRTIRIGVTAAF